MGIIVGRDGAVSLNDAVENGVNTSVAANPTHRRHKGLDSLHIFKRYPCKGRGDDGNPLIHALKGKSRDFTITAHWRQQVMMRARVILTKETPWLQNHDYCLPIPSSSPLCGDLARLVSAVSGVPVLLPVFLRKALVGDLLDDYRADPPKMRRSQQVAVTSRVSVWEGLSRDDIVEVKEISTTIRELFKVIRYTGVIPDAAPPLEGSRVLIVDDIMSSGASVFSVRDILEGLGVGKVSYVSLLGPLD